MSRNWWTKVVVLFCITAASIWMVTPSLLNWEVDRASYWFKQRINLGLDLQGGLYMALGVDFSKVFQEVVRRQGESLEERAKQKDIACGPYKIPEKQEDKEDPRVSMACPTKEAKEKLHALIKSDFELFRITDDKANEFELGLSKLYRDQVREKTISQSIEVIRNRIDEFGVAEPIITSQGTDRLSVELPGIKDVERAKELIGRTAKLEFKIVENEQLSSDAVAALVSEIEVQNNLRYKEGEKFSEYVKKINEYAKSKLPAGTEIAFEREGGRHAVGTAEDATLTRIPYILSVKTAVTGDDLQDAYVQIDPSNNMPQVALTFNPKGAQVFEKVTEENIRRQMAIVLDGIVHVAPMISNKISNGQAVITLGQADYNAMLNEAKDIAIVLRAGALPAQLEFLEERVIGPSLGSDSIQKGKWATLIGCLAVFLFMLVYYRLSGLIADFSLLLNVLFVLAILVSLEATLTLPGIAGIALTVGIAVDSNVVIYERIREELRAGKPSKVAVDLGFNRAFRTILDANIVNAVAAFILFQYGTGPIKGFAVTLLIGILTTLFTAVFVCRLLFDWYLDKCDVKELSI